MPRTFTGRLKGRLGTNVVPYNALVGREEGAQSRSKLNTNPHLDCVWIMNLCKDLWRERKSRGKR